MSVVSGMLPVAGHFYMNNHLPRTTDNRQQTSVNGIIDCKELFSSKVNCMWYFAWILGVLLACAFGIINVMWMETEEMLGADKDHYVSLKE